MPRIKRWFPVSHDINGDPEMWEARGLFGDRVALGVWLEILSIADRNEGRIPGTFEQVRNQLAAKCRCRRSAVELMLNWSSTRLWLELKPTLRVCNYADYHRTRGTVALPSEPIRTSSPNPKTDSPKNGKLAAAPRPKNPAFSDRLHKAGMAIAGKYPEVWLWVGQGIKGNWPQDELAETLERMARSEQFDEVEKKHGYLDKVLDRVHQNKNAKEHDEINDKRKQAEAAYAKKLAGG